MKHLPWMMLPCLISLGFPGTTAESNIAEDIPFVDEVCGIDNMDQESTDIVFRYSCVSLNFPNSFSPFQVRDGLLKKFPHADPDWIIQKERAEAKRYFRGRKESLIEKYHWGRERITDLDCAYPYLTFAFGEVITKENLPALLRDYRVPVISEDYTIAVTNCFTPQAEPLPPELWDIDQPDELTFADAQKMIGLDGASSVSGTPAKIGVMDLGFLDNRNDYFVNSSITVHEDAETRQQTGNHPNFVSSIITGKEGICQESPVYFSLAGDKEFENLQWMADNGVNVINMSYHNTITKFNRYDIESYSHKYDSFAYNNLIVLVAAAGNLDSENDDDNSEMISAPGCGKNVMTVGAVDMQSNQLEEFSRRRTFSQQAKPTVVAPDGFKIPFTDTVMYGTSFSAPLVTCEVALAMKKDPRNRLYPERMPSLVATNADLLHYKSSKYYGASSYAGFDSAYGLGLVDFTTLSRNINRCACFSYENGAAGNELSFFSVRIKEPCRLKASAFFYAQPDGQGGIALTDYDFYLKDSSGYQILSSETNDSNWESLEGAVCPGTYHLTIKRNGNRVTQNDDIGALSWRIEA